MQVSLLESVSLANKRDTFSFRLADLKLCIHNSILENKFWKIFRTSIILLIVLQSRLINLIRYTYKNFAPICNNNLRDINKRLFNRIDEKSIIH